MTGNVLTGVVRITAPNVDTVFNKVSVSVTKAEAQLKRLSTTSGGATLALTNLGRVVQDAPFGFLGIANNLNPLLESFQRLKAQTGSTGGAFKALAKDLGGAGGLGFALSLASTALILFGDKLFGAGEEAKKAKSDTEALRDSIKGVFKEVAREATEVGSLVAVLNAETETRKRKLAAIKELQKIQPEIFAGLKLEGEAVVGLDNAYKNYIDNLKNVIAAKILQAKIEQKIEELLRRQGVASELNVQQFVDGMRRMQKARTQAGDDVRLDKVFQGQDKKVKEELDAIQRQIDGFFADLSKVTKGIKLTVPGDVTVKPDKAKLDTGALGKLLGQKTGVDLAADAIQDAFDLIFLKKFIKIKPKFDITGGGVAGTQVGDLSDAEKALIQAGKDLSKVFNEALQSGIGEGLASLGEGIGNILSGKDFGTQIFQVLGSLLEQIGKALIKFGIIQTGIKKILDNPLLPGGFAIGLGITAIALAQLMKNISGARALGGPVRAGGTYLVGERGPELFRPNTAGEIVPNNQLGGRGVSGSGVMVNITGTFVQRGMDLVAVLALANQSKQRLQ